MKIVLLAASVILIGIASAFTFRVEKSKTDAAREIIGYFQKQIVPVMKPQREQLDQFLTAEEELRVESLRKELHDLLKTRKQKQVGWFFEESGVPYSEDQQNVLNQTRDRFRKVMTEIWQIADLHKAEIHDLLKPAEAHKHIWKSDIKTMITNNIDEKYLVILNKNVVTDAENKQIPEYLAPVIFLLWNPNKSFLSTNLFN